MTDLGKTIFETWKRNDSKYLLPSRQPLLSTGKFTAGSARYSVCNSLVLLCNMQDVRTEATTLLNKMVRKVSATPSSPSP